ARSACVSVAEDLTLQHTKLVAQKQDLDLLLPLRPTPKRNQLEQPAQRPLRERENHAPRTTRHGIRAHPSPIHRHTPSRTSPESELSAPTGSLRLSCREFQALTLTESHALHLV